MKGSGHAILCAKSFVGDEPFAVLNGDDVVYNEGTPCLKQLMDAYDRFGTGIIGVQTVPHDQICKYGSVKYGRHDGRAYEIEDFIEKPPVDQAPSDLACLGRYIITPDLFDYLETQEPGAGGEIQLSDALRRQAHDRRMIAYDFEGRRYDIGDKLGYLEAV